MKMNSKKWMVGTIAGLTTIGVFLIVVLTAFGNNGKPNTNVTASSSLTNQQRAAQKQLTVEGSLTTGNGLFNCTAVTKTVGLSNGAKTPVFTVGARAPVGQRLWSDATNVPLKPQTLAAEQAVVCHDPAQAGMVMNGLGAQKVGNVNVASLNSWMKAQGSPRVISQWAQGCMSKSDIQVHLQCARTMSLAATLLGRFHADGIQKSPTAWNYHLAGGGLVVGKVPVFELNPKQYTGYFLSLSVTAKTGGCFVHVGFNVGTSAPNGGDQRLAGMSCVSPKPISPSKAPSSPGSTPPSTHSTPPGTTRPPGSTPPGTPSSTPPGTLPPSSPPHTYVCPCVSPTKASQPVPTPPANTQSVPSSPPSQNPTVPYNSPSPAPATSGGYNGGSTSQPGTTAPPDTPLPSATGTGNGGGF